MILDKPYDKEPFDAFLKNFLPDYQKDERPVRTPDSSILTKVTQLGTSRAVGVTILEAECEETDSNKRIAITQAAFKVLRDHSIRNALVAFHDGNDQWRLSLLTSTLEIKDGKVVKKDSNPRRYSYLLGVGAKTVTPYKYLVEKGRVEDIKQLQDRFSVEVVNKQFYASVAELFTKLVGGERGTTKYPGLLKINSVISQNVEHQEFAVRLIGRIIFSWFLKEKKSAAGVPIVPSELLSLDAVASHADYYHSILEPLFFELLNKRVERRHESLREVPFSTVPYLNGGLFSPQRSDFYNQNSFNGAGTPGLTHIPDSWFIELFTVLEQYSFTVDENTSYDVDLSIDPEMLGRIFENLLAEINPETGESARKSTGSFYTPREIVDYMVDSSLLEFLKSKTGAGEEKLKALISWGQADDEEYPLTDSEKQKVVAALADLTILDPACGSGAFPIGILQKVVYILQQADPKAEIWLENQLKNIASPELKRDIQEKYESENYDWLRKYGVIRETIFGIDIQTIATEISKLRCFLTLIIEEEVDDNKANRGVHALPNLDFKFVTANSLVGLPDSSTKTKGQGVNLFEDATHIEQLKYIRNQYFGANADERARLQVEFKNLQMDMLRSRIATGGATSDLYNTLSDWDPFSHNKTGWFDSDWMFGIDGFDIVIGNPPYIQIQKMDDAAKLLYKREGYAVFSKTSDIYCLFYEFALNILKTDGVLSYITSNSWLRTRYGMPLRKLLVEYNPLSLINFDDSKVFASAVVETSIIVVQKSSNNNALLAVNYNLANGSTLSIADYANKNGTLLSELDPQGWTIGQEDSLALKQKIKENAVLLKDSNVSIFRGFTTGFNDAFFISTETRDRLIAEDPGCAEVIQPAMRGKDISTYNYKWSGIWVILIKAGWTDTNRGQQEPEEFFRAAYPSIYRHLKYTGETINGKGKGLFDRDDQGDYWWELRACVYYDEFKRDKIIWGELSDKPKFAFDTETHYANNSIFLMTGENLKYILAVLNSSLGKWYFDQISTSSGMGTNRWLKYKIEQLPIARVNNTNEDIARQIKEKVDIAIGSIENQQQAKDEINNLVYKLYNLAPEEIAIVEG